MPLEIPMYEFDQETLLTAMIRFAGVHSGKWILGVTMTAQAQPVTAADGMLTVGMVTAFKSVQLNRLDLNQPQPSNMVVVDAAQVNPQEISLGGGIALAN